MTHMMCWGAVAGVAVAVEVSSGFARFSLSDRCSTEGAKSMKSACGWDVCSQAVSAGVENGRAGDCLKLCRCCRGRTCTSLVVQGTCHRRRERSHMFRLVEKRRAARGARLGKNFEMKSTRPACRIVTSRFSWTPRVLTTHTARSRDLAEGRRNRSVARRARCVEERRQRGELGERPDSEASRRPVREKRLRDSKAASRSRDLSEMAEVVQKRSVFGHGTKCNTCALVLCPR